MKKALILAVLLVCSLPLASDAQMLQGIVGASHAISSGYGYSNSYLFQVSNGTQNTVSIAAGHAILLLEKGISGQGALTPSDSAGDTFTTALGPITDGASGNVNVIYCAIASAPVTWVKVAVTNDVGGTVIGVGDYTGITSCTADKTNYADIVSSGTFSSGASGTTTNANEVVVGWLSSNSSTCNWSSIGSGSPNTRQNSSTASPSSLYIDWLPTSTGSFTASAHCADSGAYGLASVATFH